MKEIRSLRVGKLSREGSFAPRDRALAGDDDRIRELSFASETEEVERWFGIEILDHGPGAADLSRLNNAGPVLLYHDTTKPVAVIERAWIDTDARRSLALVRFGKGEAASDALRDVDDGILTHVSFTYVPKKMVEEKGKPPVYRVTEWQGLEISLVTVAADDSVGVGRGLGDDEDLYDVPVERSQTMDENQTVENRAVTPPPVKVDVKAEREDATKAERSRVKMINAHAEVATSVFEDARQVAATFISEGRSADEFTEQLPLIGKRRESAKIQPTLDLGSDGQRELGRYSLLKAIRAFRNPGDRAAHDAAARELEFSSEIARRTGREPASFFMPLEVLGRTLVAGTTTAGGFFVPTDHRGDLFIEALRNRSLCAAAGATILPGLSGKVAIPAISAGASGTWVEEGGAASKTTQTIAQVALDPKTVTAWSEITDMLLKQSSPQVDQLIMDDLARALGVSLDLAGLHGTAANEQPRGIAATSGIGAVVGGTDGAAPSWDHITKLEEEVAVDNADLGALAYMTNPKVRRRLKNTAVIASTDSRLVWETGKDRPLNDYKAWITNQVSSTLTKGSGAGVGVCSAIFFGNWNDLLMGLWGGLDVLVDPYSQSTTGKVRIVARLLCDIAVRRAVSFAAMLDARTDI
jgi:HK97 family phage major capsid protein